MNLRYFKTLMKKISEYDKKATNPFLYANFSEISKNIQEKTYIWITK